MSPSGSRAYTVPSPEGTTTVPSLAIARLTTGPATRRDQTTPQSRSKRYTHPASLPKYIAPSELITGGWNTRDPVANEQWSVHAGTAGRWGLKPVCPGSPPSIGHGERPYEGRSGALAAPTGGTPNATTTVATIIIRPTHAPPAIPSAGGAYEGLSRGSRVAAEARRDAAETRSSTESESPLGGTRIGIRLGRGDHRPVCTLGHAKPPTRGSMDDEEPAVPRLGELDP